MALTKVQNTGIADDAVTTDKIENSTVLAADIAPGTLTNAKLSNSAITLNGSSVSLGGTASVKHLDWQAITVADGSTQLTAEAGKGYFLDTNTGVIEVLLPGSPTRGDTIALVDYGGTFGTNQCIINTGGQLIDSTAGPDFKVTTDNAVVELVYVDSNKGWLVKLLQAAGTTPGVIATGTYGATFIQATGGTVTSSGGYKIHTFTGDGCFVVSALGSGVPTDVSSKVSYMVVAGGGGGGTAAAGGGGGAGGFREGRVATPDYTASPLVTTGLTVTATTFPITVGAGGAAAGNSRPEGSDNTAGSNSVFSTITSAGGGKGGGFPSQDGTNGGSGGGSANGPNGSPGNGNTPPVSPPQGNNAGAAHATTGSGSGGGGATSVGVNEPANHGGTGGAGATTHINGSPVIYAGGGGGSGSCTGGDAGPGGGGAGSNEPSNAADKAENGTANTGGGGGGLRCAPIPSAYTAPGGGSGTGGKGIVIIRYKNS